MKNESLLCLAQEPAIKCVQKKQKAEPYKHLSETGGL